MVALIALPCCSTLEAAHMPCREGCWTLKGIPFYVCQGASRAAARPPADIDASRLTVSTQKQTSLLFCSAGHLPQRHHIRDRADHQGLRLVTWVMSCCAVDPQVFALQAVCRGVHRVCDRADHQVLHLLLHGEQVGRDAHHRLGRHAVFPHLHGKFSRIQSSYTSK